VPTCDEAGVDDEDEDAGRLIVGTVNCDLNTCVGTMRSLCSR
jgi:hypothetical protein